jgi:DNA-binding NarL/FixJ family response regulator
MSMTPTDPGLSSARLDVVVIEDEQLLGDLLGEWVVAQPDLHLVGVFRSVAEARRELPGRAVEVMVVDLNLPDGSGLDLAVEASSGRLGAGRPRGVVVLSGEARVDLIADLPSKLSCSWAYLLKSTNTSRRLRQAIDAVVAGMVMIDPELHRHGVPIDPALATLTDTERSVLGALAAGRSNKAIAAEVHVSVKTVERILSTIYSKLGVDARDESVNPRVQAVLRWASAPTSGAQ